MQTRFYPLRTLGLRPAFWGFDRDFKDVIEQIEATWDGIERSQFSDFKENDKAFMLSLDMPGVSQKSLEVEVVEQTLNIKASRKRGFDKDSSQNLVTVEKTISIPKNVDREKIQAHCEDGVLYLLLPKHEAVQPKKIKVNTTEQTSSWLNFFNKIEDKSST
ncbi:MAG: Hsp20/alpha crystallin family protein [Bacteriovoracaceae bacterium]|nr:Hsp20/alpha crystallin family protein [Bacteriovoracaceae bacterium]